MENLKIEEIFGGAVSREANVGLERCFKDLEDRESVPGKRAVIVRITIGRDDEGVEHLASKIEVKLPGRYEPQFYSSEGKISRDKNQLVFNYGGRAEGEEDTDDGEDAGEPEAAGRKLAAVT